MGEKLPRLTAKEAESLLLLNPKIVKELLDVIQYA